jgi:hypothetical protein
VRALVAVLLMTVAGCGDDTTSATTQDLATAGSDLSAAADLAMLSCANILDCVKGCGENLVCQLACTQNGTTVARATFSAFGSCLAQSCGAGDGGSDGCTSPTDSSNGCQTCLSTTAANALNSGAPCNTEYLACAGS